MLGGRSLLGAMIHLWPTVPAVGGMGTTIPGRRPRQGTTASKLEKSLTVASGTTVN